MIAVPSLAPLDRAGSLCEDGNQVQLMPASSMRLAKPGMSALAGG